MDETQRYRQYVLEKELAATIRAASPATRQKVIKQAYERLYREVTWHTGLHRTEEQKRQKINRKHSTFGWALGERNDVLEVGCGTGDFLASLAPRQRSCVGLEIAELKADQFPDAGDNLSFKVMQGMHFPDIENASFDVVFTSQVLEHFHPDDVPEHLAEVYRVLRPGGRYVLDTPTALNGPHDISRGFDNVATGMHLKEWTYAEIVPLLKDAGFRKIKVQVLPQRLLRNRTWLAQFGLWPAGWKVFAEKMICLLPPGKPGERMISMLMLYTLLVIAEK